jgi:hypothetical protein
VIDLNKAIDRLHQLDDQHLEDLVRRLDETLADCRSGPIDEDTQTTISVAGAARILLRNRRAAARHNRANAIVRTLISATETTE